MPRVLRNAVWLLCIFLFTGCTFLWLRTAWYTDGFTKRDRHTDTMVYSDASSFIYVRHDGMLVSNESLQFAFSYNPDRFHPWQYSRVRSLHPLSWGHLEYTREPQYNPSRVGLPETVVRIRIPYSIPAMASGTSISLLALRAYRQRRRKRCRARDGLCAQCGYDLRGGHEHCPECGTPCEPNILPSLALCVTTYPNAGRTKGPPQCPPPTSPPPPITPTP